jgi:uncharacterized protein YbcI
MQPQQLGTDAMEQAKSTVAQQIAQAGIAFERCRTGRAPSKVTVVLTNDTLVITLHGVLSPAEKALAKNSAGAAQVEELHQQLFANSSDELLAEIKRITGQEVREATAEIETSSGTVVKVFTTGTEVQVFRLAGSVPTGTWSGDGNGHESNGHS